MESFTKEIRKLLLAGLGAAAEGREKGGKLLDELAEKGENALNQGKVLNEELKRNIRGTLNNSKDAKGIMDAVKKMDAEQLETLKAVIACMEGKNSEEADGDEAKMDDEGGAAAEDCAAEAEAEAPAEDCTEEAEVEETDAAADVEESETEKEE